MERVEVINGTGELSIDLRNDSVEEKRLVTAESQRTRNESFVW